MTAKTIQVRWNGSKDDPDTIVQHGITFEKGKWTPVPDVSDKPNDPNQGRLAKFASNPWFEVQGADKGEQAPNAGGTLANTVSATKAHGEPERAPLTTFKAVSRPLPAVKGQSAKVEWIVIDEKGEATKDVYATQADAQTVADALNQVHR